MQKVRNLFKTVGFSVLLFFLAFLFFNWPFLSAVSSGHPHTLFVYLFLVWGIVIFFIFLMGRSSGD